jgi:hypothetical protein
MKKVDVIVHASGKPWQTLCTLKSLMSHSGEHIDKIFFIKEPTHPFNDNVDWIMGYFDNLIVYQPEKSVLMYTIKDITNQNERFNCPFQYVFENSNKEFVFFTHNDVLYTGDVIGDMLNKINDSIGIGRIGQCWNCPAHQANLCSGEKFYEWNPTYEEVVSLGLPYVRTNLSNVDKITPKPLPECRLNEWACLINIKMSNKETYPNGDTPFFGVFGPDSGVAWFRSLHLKGYKFINYDDKYIHSYWSELSSGYQTVQSEHHYVKSEENAKKYYNENFII